jgi:hypothetical protein
MNHDCHTKLMLLEAAAIIEANDDSISMQDAASGIGIGERSSDLRFFNL